MCAGLGTAKGAAMIDLFSTVRAAMLALCTLLALPLLAEQARAAETLDGVFLGLDGAEGITIRLSQGGRGYVGEIEARGGGRADINAEISGDEATGPLTLQGQPGTVRFSPRPVGLAMVWRPNGGGAAPLVYAFRRQSLGLPPPPAEYVPSPQSSTDEVDALDFLHSYEFWDADSVGFAYDRVRDKFRVIMRTYPAVHGDILWKLCQATVVPDQLGEALRGQGVTCPEVNAKLRASQTNGGFARFKQRVRREKYDAILSVECARGIHTADLCIQAANRTQQAATSLDTLGSILRGL